MRRKERMIRLVRSGKSIGQGEFLAWVKNAILTEPKAYNQTAVRGAARAYLGEKIMPPGPPTCSSPACIAGWMEYKIFGNNKCRDYEDIHDRVFGGNSYPWLFMGGFGALPKGLESFLDTPFGSEARAVLACGMIDLYTKQINGRLG